MDRNDTVIDYRPLEVWFLTGSQHLYGPQVLQQVEADARQMVAGLNAAGLPVQITPKPVLTTPESITDICLAANSDSRCIGLITWMHTFSPGKMWLAGLAGLRKPFAHLHTQFNRDIPWSSIDMDFMNLNQSAHGGREFGFTCSRLRLNRKIIVGHWQAPSVQAKLSVWMRAAAAWHDAQHARIARIGDNMREVAVTEGDKVEAQIRLGYRVNGYGMGDLVAQVAAAADADVEQLCRLYDEQYVLAPSLRPGGPQRTALADAARIEWGLRAFLEARGCVGFTDTFEDLHGLAQLPGLAVQRLMADGYGYGAEGDWKHAALVRAMKVMSHGLEGGVSFMEDYTYHLHPAGHQVLGAHMLEICPSIAASQPRCEIHPLGIGGKADPVRLVFEARSGPAINVSVVDMGQRFRMVVNKLDVIPPEQPLPRLVGDPQESRTRPTTTSWPAAIWAGGSSAPRSSPRTSARSTWSAWPVPDAPTAWPWRTTNCTPGACWCWAGCWCRSTCGPRCSPCPSSSSGGSTRPAAGCCRSSRWSPTW
jgi:L-arabinose isomerase